MRIKTTLLLALQSFIFKKTSYGSPPYYYSVEPIQLASFINELERLQNIEGSILEVGVGRGMTTKFLCQHLSTTDTSNTDYYAIDTFSGFITDHLDHEVKNRGKKAFELKGFDFIDFEVWKSNFKSYPFLKAIKSDCSQLDFIDFFPIKFVFLDVDLYLPTKNALPKIYEQLIPGGVIFVDDCRDGTSYDGAYQAFIEFCAEQSIEPKVIGSKCGVIYKQ